MAVPGPTALDLTLTCKTRSLKANQLCTDVNYRHNDSYFNHNRQNSCLTRVDFAVLDVVQSMGQTWNFIRAIYRPDVETLLTSFPRRSNDDLAARCVLRSLGLSQAC